MKINKIYGKSILGTVRSNCSRFLAIFSIVALGTGFLSGLLAAPVDMRLSAQEYFRTSGLYDIKIQATQGFTNDDVETVRTIQGVEGVMPARDIDLMLTTSQGENLTTRLMSLPSDTLPETDQLNRLTLVEGRLPAAPGEIALGLTPSFRGKLPALGDTLTLGQSLVGDTIAQALPSTFTVVGIVRSAAYFSGETEYTSAGSGTVGLFAYTPDSSFHLDYYTTLYLSVEGAAGVNTFSQDYDQVVGRVCDELDDITEERAQIRYDQITNDVRAALEDFWAEYDQRKAEAEAELDNAWKEYTEKKAAVQVELTQAQQELADGRSQLTTAEQELADIKAEIDRKQTELDANRSVFYEQLPEYEEQIADGYNQAENKKSQLDQAQARLDQTRASLTALQDSKTQFWTETVPLLVNLGLTAIDTSDQSDEATIIAITTAEKFLEEYLGGQEEGEDGTPNPAAPATLSTSPAGPTVPGPNSQQAAALLEQLDLLRKGLTTLTDQGTDLDTSLGQIPQKQAEIEEGRRQLEESLNLLREKEQDLKDTIAATEGTFADAEAGLAQARAQYADGQAQLETSRQELEAGQAEYQKNKTTAEQELAEGLKEYQSAQSQVQQELEDILAEILSAESEVQKIEKGKWLLSDRMENASVAGYADNADRISAVGKVFPLFFFLVSALVALTTMTRMVEEERSLTGTLKALGYSHLQITAKYVLYALTATLAGSMAGTIIGMELFPRIILGAYAMYHLPVRLTPFHWQYGLLATGAALGCTLLATLSACRSLLREQPASLMRPKAPKAGKRIFLEYITPLWSRLQFTHKVTARNLFLYKKRFFMTVVGIAGCTALLVTGFGLHDSIADIVVKQFGDISHYQMIVSLQGDNTPASRELQAILEDGSQVTGHLPVCQEDMTAVSPKGGSADKLYLMVPQDIEDMNQYFTFRQRIDGVPVAFAEDSVIITEKLAELLDLTEGDDITIRNTEGKEATLTITGICENYVQHYLYTTPQVYEKAFGEEPLPNILLCQLNETVNTPETEEILSSNLLQCRDVAGVQFVRSAAETFSQNLDSVNYIVVVLIFMAGALAFVVLYTLTDINITERTKELATIKVLGFYDSEVSAYIYRETAILTLIGTLCGLFLGIFMHATVVRNAEVDIVMFDRTLYPPSFVWAALLTLLFSLAVNLVMSRKLKKISMVESMKAPE